jgi:hypothetical protein
MPVAQVRVEPPWAPRAKLPTEEEARYLFESLHRNIYRAFDYETESEIYDALARSIDDALLDEVYGEVYESLILEADGGAVCQIKGVKILQSDIILPERAPRPRFDVRARWRVTGTVRHWGHSHWRTNEYDALYSLSGDDDRWRITSVDVRNQERLTTSSGL